MSNRQCKVDLNSLDTPYWDFSSYSGTYRSRAEAGSTAAVAAAAAAAENHLVSNHMQ
jgi:hypothetical protein